MKQYSYLSILLIFRTLLSYLSSTPQDLLFVHIILLQCFDYVFQISITYYFIFISAHFDLSTFKAKFSDLHLRPYTFSPFFYIYLLYDIEYFEYSHYLIVIKCYFFISNCYFNLIYYFSYTVINLN